MDKISSLISDHTMKYDSGIDASALMHNFSSMSLDSSNSFGSSNGDVLNRARIDSMDGDLSIKEELNRARILSQDFTLDSIGLSADEDVSETHINVSIKLTNRREGRNKENIVNSSSKYIKADNGDKVVCKQFVKNGTNKKNQFNCKYGVNKLHEASPRTKPLSPNKNNNSLSSRSNITSRAGQKKANTRKKRTVRNSFSPPKLSSLLMNNSSSLVPSNLKNSVKQSNYIPDSKLTKLNSKISSLSTPYSEKKYNCCRDDSIYSTPVDTPSKLNNQLTTLSPNITIRSPSPWEKISNSQYVTVRSTPASQKTPPPPPLSRSPPSPTLSPTSSWYSAEDSLEFFPNELSSSYCHSSPNANQGKQYFSPLFDDSAIVEASCSGKKYFNFPSVKNLENVSAENISERERPSYPSENFTSSSHDDWNSNKMMGSLLGEKLGIVFNQPVSPSPQGSDEQFYVDFQKFLDRLEGTTKVRKKLYSSLDDSNKSIKSSPTLSPLCCDCRLPDELSEAELDEITWIHTTCNGQQIASRVFLGEGTDESFTVFPPPRSPRHLKWSQNLIEMEYDKIDNDKKITSTPLKSILKKRPENFVFPYNGDEPSPYLITRTRHVFSPV